MPFMRYKKKRKKKEFVHNWISHVEFNAMHASIRTQSSTPTKVNAEILLRQPLL